MTPCLQPLGVDLEPEAALRRGSHLLAVELHRHALDRERRRGGHVQPDAERLRHASAAHARHAHLRSGRLLRRRRDNGWRRRVCLRLPGLRQGEDRERGGPDRAAIVSQVRRPGAIAHLLAEQQVHHLRVEVRRVGDVRRDVAAEPLAEGEQRVVVATVAAVLPVAVQAPDHASRVEVERRGGRDVVNHRPRRLALAHLVGVEDGVATAHSRHHAWIADRDPVVREAEQDRARVVRIRLEVTARAVRLVRAAAVVVPAGAVRVARELLRGGRPIDVLCRGGRRNPA